MTLSPLITWAPGLAIGLIAAAPVCFADPAREDQSVAERFSARQQTDGMRVGAFILRPELDLELLRDSNIFSDDEREQADVISQVAGSARLASDWSNHSLALGGRVNAERYRDNPEEDTNDYETDLAARIDLSVRDSLRIDAKRGRDTLSRDSVESRSGNERLRYDTSSLQLGFDRRFGAVSGSVFVARRNQDFDDSVVNPAITNQRDNKTDSLGLRITYGAQTHRQYYAELAQTATDYSNRATTSDFDRSSDTAAITLGSVFTLSDALGGYARIGYFGTSYDERSISDQDGLFTDLGLVWNVTRLTSLTSTVSRNFQSTTLNESPGYWEDRLGLVIDHELLRTLKLSASVFYREEDYERIDREEADFDFEIAADFQLGRNTTVSLFHRSEQRNSSGLDQGREYDGDLYGLGLTWKR